MEKKELRIKLKRRLMEQQLKERNIIDHILVLKQSFGFSEMIERKDADTEFTSLEILDIIMKKYETVNTIVEDITIEEIDDVDIRYKARAFAPYIPKDKVEVDIELNFYKHY